MVAVSIVVSVQFCVVFLCLLWEKAKEKGQYSCLPSCFVISHSFLFSFFLHLFFMVVAWLLPSCSSHASCWSTLVQDALLSAVLVHHFCIGSNHTSGFILFSSCHSWKYLVSGVKVWEVLDLFCLGDGCCVRKNQPIKPNWSSVVLLKIKYYGEQLQIIKKRYVQYLYALDNVFIQIHFMFIVLHTLSHTKAWE